MTTWALINAAGVAAFLTDSDTEPAWPDHTAVDVTGVFMGPGWALTGGEWTAPTAVVDRTITPYALKARMTAAERIGIRTVAKSSAEVEDFQDMLDSARIIDLDDPALAGGLAALEAAGLLAAGRAAEVLAAPVQDKERP